MAYTAQETSAVLLQALQAQAADPDRMFGKETYDLAMVAALSPQDRAVLGRWLAERIDAGDPVAAMTAGAGRLVELTEDLLRHQAANGGFGLSVRRALVALGHGRSVLSLLVLDAQVASPVRRMAAVIALGDIGLPLDSDRLTALLTALGDRSYLVQKAAFDVLVELSGVTQFVHEPGTSNPDLRSPLRQRLLLVCSDLKALRLPALAEMQDLFVHLHRGESPQSLGLAYVPTVAPELFHRLGSALFNANLQIPLESLLSLSGQERRYAETLLAVSLARHWEASPPALVALGTRWVVPALREAMAVEPVEPRFVEVAGRALAELESA